MNKEDMVFVGYCTGRGLPDITPEQAKKLTHLNVAFAVVEGDKLVINRPLRQKLLYLGQLRRYNPALAILISTGGGSGKGHGWATKPEQIGTFVQSTMDLVREFGFDGIDCDWEFPCDTGDLAEKQQHLELMRLYREGLDAIEKERGKKCWLTIAAGCRVENCDGMDVAGTARYLDFVNLMTYDFRWGCDRTLHHTNPYPPKPGNPARADDPESVAWSIDLFKRYGLPLEKMVVGGAFYSHRFDGVQGAGNGSAPSGSCSPRQPGYGLPYTGAYSFGPHYTAIYSLYEKSTEYVKYWDEDAKAPWLFNGETFISYEDPQSLKYKAEYVKKLGLKGMMYWEHSCDSTGILFNAIYDNLML